MPETELSSLRAGLRLALNGSLNLHLAQNANDLVALFIQPLVPVLLCCPAQMFVLIIVFIFLITEEKEEAFA